MGGLWWIIHKLAMFNSALNSGCHQCNGIRFDLDHLHGLVPVKDGQINRLAWDTSQPKKFQWNHASSTARHEQFKKIDKVFWRKFIFLEFQSTPRANDQLWPISSKIFCFFPSQSIQICIWNFNTPKASWNSVYRTFPQPNPVPQKKRYSGRHSPHPNRHLAASVSTPTPMAFGIFRGSIEIIL